MNQALSLAEKFLTCALPLAIFAAIILWFRMLLLQSEAIASILSDPINKCLCKCLHITETPNTQSRVWARATNQSRVHKRPWPLNCTSGFFLRAEKKSAILKSSRAKYNVVNVQGNYSVAEGCSVTRSWHLSPLDTQDCLGCSRYWIFRFVAIHRQPP